MLNEKRETVMQIEDEIILNDLNHADYKLLLEGFQRGEEINYHGKQVFVIDMKTEMMNSVKTTFIIRARSQENKK
jgi:hypothetical protein